MSTIFVYIGLGTSESSRPLWSVHESSMHETQMGKGGVMRALGRVACFKSLSLHLSMGDQPHAENILMRYRREITTPLRQLPLVAQRLFSITLLNSEFCVLVFLLIVPCCSAELITLRRRLEVDEIINDADQCLLTAEGARYFIDD